MNCCSNLDYIMCIPVFVCVGEVLKKLEKIGNGGSGHLKKTRRGMKKKKKLGSSN